MRVLIAPDKFKGSLTAAEVADHLAKGLAEAGAHSRTLPLADGSVAAALASGFHPLPVTVRGATGQNHSTVIALDDDTAIVEVANTCGLSTLPGGIRAPISASSYGFSEAIRAALTLARTRLVLALGGSASTDGGIGMLAALGHRFLDRAGQLLAPTAENLDLIHCIDSSRAVNLDGVDLIVAGDVTSPLLGLTGAAAVFGPQRAPPQHKSPNSTPDWTTSSPPAPAPDTPTPTPSPALTDRAPPAASVSPPCCWAPPQPPEPTTSWTCSTSSATSATPT